MIIEIDLLPTYAFGVFFLYCVFLPKARTHNIKNWLLTASLFAIFWPLCIVWVVLLTIKNIGAKI